MLGQVTIQIDDAQDRADFVAYVEGECKARVTPHASGAVTVEAVKGGDPLQDVLWTVHTWVSTH